MASAVKPERYETYAEYLAAKDRKTPRLVNTVSACLISGVSRATLYRWMQKRLVDYVVLPSGHRRIFVASLFRSPEAR